MTTEKRVEVVEADGGFELLVNGRAVDGFLVREAADTARGEWVTELESMRADTREATVRECCKALCTLCAEGHESSAHGHPLGHDNYAPCDAIGIRRQTRVVT